MHHVKTSSVKRHRRRVMKILLVFGLCLVIEASDIKKRSAKKLVRRWMERWEGRDGVSMDCSFKIRLGLVPAPKRSLVSPALLVESRRHENAIEIKPNDSLNAFMFCEFDVHDHSLYKKSKPAHVLVAETEEYLFRHWPYLANRIKIAETSGARIMLLVGSIQSDKREYNKILASRIAIDHPYVSGIYYLDLDSGFYTLSKNQLYQKVEKEKQFDLEFFRTEARQPFWYVDTKRFYARDAPLSRLLFDRVLSEAKIKNSFSIDLSSAILYLATTAHCLSHTNNTSISLNQYPHTTADLHCNFRLYTHTLQPSFLQSFSANPIQRSLNPRIEKHNLRFKFFSYYYDNTTNSQILAPGVSSLKVLNLLVNMTPPVQFTGAPSSSPHLNLLRVLGLWPRGEMVTEVD